MKNNKRKEGWYWVKVQSETFWRLVFYNGELWYLWDDLHPDSFFHSINEKRIVTPDEPCILDRAIELIRNLQISNDSQEQLFSSVICILEQLKSEK